MTGRRGRKPSVVDTNVAVVANRRSGESYSCANACAQALLKIRNSGTLVVDEGNRILGEYRRHCSMAGQPGVGDFFVKWVHDSLGRQDLVQIVPITATVGDSDTFLEFPNHQDLSAFDPSDRKFVAVANAHPDKPPILQGTDNKWWGWKDTLKACGITVVFLCPVEIQQIYNRKFGRSWQG